ncbi:hypothetical protein [Nodosilinea sp. E11]|uniref:hypothetical protein n=1 Tax=Nodosilinea sp. E11 TaxID=3037479 RepID=UPI0029343344|nr:hypothetical protein [Nodosilinea sp. E11]WOD37668.1 hypothetical protein RRF56_15775 [Nodosilinea sp. E11]
MPRPHLLLLGPAITAILGSTALALPPPEDIPEEILRTQVITEARSPLTGESITAADYAVLQDRLRDPNTETVVDPDLAHLIYLLQLRRVLRPVVPFLR